jgi:hypothetical protein
MFGKHVYPEVTHPLRRKTKMKKFFIGLLAVMFVAGAAYAGAPDMDFSGMINTRGQYFSNDDAVTEDSGDYMIYDMEFDADLNIKASDKSGVFLNFEIHDESWLETPGGSDDKTGDDQIAFKRAFGYHTFGTGTKVEFGVLTGAAFGTAFGDNGDGRYRVKFTHPTDVGVFVGVLEKNQENGPAATDDYDAEADDSDLYAVAYVAPFGDLTFQGLGVYALVNIGDADAGDPDATDEEADLALTIVSLNLLGSLGAIGFETEFMYKNYSYDTEFDAEDYSVFGFYANGWTMMDAMKVGAQIAYGSFDDDAQAGFGFGEDYTPTIGGADAFTVGASGLSEYNAVTLLNAYLDYGLSEEMNVGGSLTYWMSNSKDNAWEDATGYEVDVLFGWKLSDTTKYSAALGQGQIDLDNGDPDPFTRIYHKIQVSF